MNPILIKKINTLQKLLQVEGYDCELYIKRNIFMLRIIISEQDIKDITQLETKRIEGG